MSKNNEVKLTNSVKFSVKKTGVVDRSHADILSSPIYKVENLYFQYLRDLKLGNLNDTSDFGAAFIAF